MLRIALAVVQDAKRAGLGAQSIPYHHITVLSIRGLFKFLWILASAVEFP